MKILRERIFLWFFCIFFQIIGIQMVCCVFAAESEFSRNLSVAQDDGKSVSERMAAIQYLGTSGELQALKPMLDMLKNPKEKEAVRCGAVRGLADLGQERSQVIEGLEQVYREPGAGENLRYTILFSLGSMRAEQSFPLLSNALSDADEMIRFKAAQAIGHIGNEPSVKLLIARLEAEKDRMVRAEIVRALGGARNDASRNAIIQALLSDPSSLVRWNAALTLKKFDPLSPEVRSAIAPALNDSSSMVRETVKGMLQ